MGGAREGAREEENPLGSERRGRGARLCCCDGMQRTAAAAACLGLRLVSCCYGGVRSRGPSLQGMAEALCCGGWRRRGCGCFASSAEI